MGRSRASGWSVWAAARGRRRRGAGRLRPPTRPPSCRPAPGRSPLTSRSAAHSGRSRRPFGTRCELAIDRPTRPAVSRVSSSSYAVRPWEPWRRAVPGRRGRGGQRELDGRGPRDHRGGRPLQLGHRRTDTADHHGGRPAPLRPIADRPETDQSGTSRASQRHPHLAAEHRQGDAIADFATTTSTPCRRRIQAADGDDMKASADTFADRSRRPASGSSALTLPPARIQRAP